MEELGGLILREMSDVRARADAVDAEGRARAAPVGRLDEGSLIEQLAEQSLELATRCLRPGGHFVCKLLDGAELQPLFARAKPLFTTSGGLVKPKASRPRSREVYLVARGFNPDAYAARSSW